MLIEKETYGQEICEAGYSTDNSFELSSQYAAGFFDGEGCIRVTLQGNNNAAGIHVFITNTCKQILEEFQRKYGGSLRLRSQETEKHKDCYQWRISNKREAKKFLIDILPFLYEKKPQVLLGIDYCNLQVLKANRYSSNYSETLKFREERVRIAKQLKELKGRK